MNGNDLKYLIFLKRYYMSKLLYVKAVKTLEKKGETVIRYNSDTLLYPDSKIKKNKNIRYIDDTIRNRNQLKAIETCKAFYKYQVKGDKFEVIVLNHGKAVEEVIDIIIGRKREIGILVLKAMIEIQRYYYSNYLETFFGHYDTDKILKELWIKFTSEEKRRTVLDNHEYFHFEYGIPELFIFNKKEMYLINIITKGNISPGNAVFYNSIMENVGKESEEVEYDVSWVRILKFLSKPPPVQIVGTIVRDDRGVNINDTFLEIPLKY